MATHGAVGPTLYLRDVPEHVIEELRRRASGNEGVVYLGHLAE